MTNCAQTMDWYGLPEPRAQGYTPRILIAEDDTDFLGLLGRYLRTDGYRVTCVKTAVALLSDLDHAREGAEPPALVVSDYRMPGMNGFRAFQQVRDWGWTLPMVLITAFGNDDLAREVKQIGVTLMRKPFDLDDFRTLVGFLAPRRKFGSMEKCAGCGSYDNLSFCWDDPRAAFLCDECIALLKKLDTD
ncbi:MAG: response regulator [Pseudomonadota bacterium]